MNFKIWFQKKIMRQLSSSKEGATEPQPRVDPKENKSKEEHLEVERSQDIQRIEHQLSSASASKQTASSPKSVTTIYGNDKEKINDYILYVLNDLPEQWIGKEMKLHVIADRRDAIWITGRVFEDVQRGLITAQFDVKDSDHLCDISLILKIADGLASFPAAVTAINPIFSFILTDIKSEAIFRRKRRIKNTIT
jgi:hypothetical protein